MLESLKRYCYPGVWPVIRQLITDNEHLTCSNDPSIPQPGRSAISINQLTQNLELYKEPNIRSLRWNKHYNEALLLVANQVMSECLMSGHVLQPLSLKEVSTAPELVRNYQRNAGYLSFETGKRSKGENIEYALERATDEYAEMLRRGYYDRPLVIAHRSSNSKPENVRISAKKCMTLGWKWRCRIILMQDLIAQLWDGRFAIPLTRVAVKLSFGEGSMTTQDVEMWVAKQRARYNRFFSSDYSKFDTSEMAWCLEDIFNRILRPLFGTLSDEDERAYSCMVYSYIHKEIHGPEGPIFSDRANISGSLMTYLINTLYNQVVKTTVLLMMGIDPHKVDSLLCGDDNLTYYNDASGFDPIQYCKLTQKYFGIKTKIEEYDCASSEQDPLFLSRFWTRDGEERFLNEVLWNLVYPERFRDYSPAKTGVPEIRAEALMILAAYTEQEATMKRYFDIHKIKADAGFKGKVNDNLKLYEQLAKLGSGFNNNWIRWKTGLLEQ
jgi:hypothetical protein